MKKSKKKRKGLRLGSVHHSLAAFYYIIMIIMAVSLMLYFVYIKTIIDPWLEFMANSTIP